MDLQEKLNEIRSLHSVIDSAWLRIECLDEALAKIKNEVAEAEKRYEEVVERREQLMHEVARQAILEGIAKVDDHLPMRNPVRFVITMHELLDRQTEVLPVDETLH